MFPKIYVKGRVRINSYDHHAGKVQVIWNYFREVLTANLKYTYNSSVIVLLCILCIESYIKYCVLPIFIIGKPWYCTKYLLAYVRVHIPLVVYGYNNKLIMPSSIYIWYVYKTVWRWPRRSSNCEAMRF